MPKSNPVIAFADALRAHMHQEFEDASVRVERGQIKVVLRESDANFVMFIGPKDGLWAITVVDPHSRQQLLQNVKEHLSRPDEVASVIRTDKTNLTLYVASLSTAQAAGVASAFNDSVTSMPTIRKHAEPRPLPGMQVA